MLIALKQLKTTYNQPIMFFEQYYKYIENNGIESNLTIYICFCREIRSNEFR